LLLRSAGRKKLHAQNLRPNAAAASLVGNPAKRVPADLGHDIWLKNNNKTSSDKSARHRQLPLFIIWGSVLHTILYNIFAEKVGLKIWQF
jgi:hypothetical protein